MSLPFTLCQTRLLVPSNYPDIRPILVASVTSSTLTCISTRPLTDGIFMSISPFKSDKKSRSHPRPIQKKLDDQPLTLSQALIITAGMAGLIGLVSGAFIRFSLTHSSNGRFLSPLQTFPALSNWTPDASEPIVDSSNLLETGDASPNNGLGDGLGDSPELRDGSDRDDSLDDTGYPKSFDEFANRSQPSFQSGQDPLEALRSGPLLRESGRLNADGTEAILPKLEDPAFEPYFDPDAADDRFYQ